jgi:ribose 1,5-bisphosphate isomerase
MDKKRAFARILGDIKKVNIQGARNIARQALRAYSLVPTKKSMNLLLSSRPTEPMLVRVLHEAGEKPYDEIIGHFDSAQDMINKNALKLVKNGDVIFTHCHSTNVTNALKYAKRKGRKFEVYNTETRPLFQGRKTANELRKAGIRVTMFVDSAAALAIEKESRNDRIYADKIFLGADALLDEGIINKIGSMMISEIAHAHKIPVYIIADSWKFTRKNVPIENRKLNEIWDRAPKNIRIKNPAFEFVPKKYITAVVSDMGVLNYDAFVKKAENPG